MRVSCPCKTAISFYSGRPDRAHTTITTKTYPTKLSRPPFYVIIKSMPRPASCVRMHRRVHRHGLRHRPRPFSYRRRRHPLLQEMPLRVFPVVRRGWVLRVNVLLPVGRQRGEPREAAELQFVVQLRV